MTEGHCNWASRIFSNCDRAFRLLTTRTFDVLVTVSTEMSVYILDVYLPQKNNKDSAVQQFGANGRNAVQGHGHVFAVIESIGPC